MPASESASKQSDTTFLRAREWRSPPAIARSLAAAALAVWLAMAAPAICSAQPAAQQPRTSTMEVITLGTGGGPVLRKERSHPANALVMGQDVVLVDVGDGVLERMAQADITMPSVKAIYLTHLHTDHVGALSTILTVRWHLGVYAPIEIYGPPGTRHLVLGLVTANRPVIAVTPPQRPGIAHDLGATVRVVEIDPPRGGEAIAVQGRYFDRILAVRNSHLDALAEGSGVALSYRFERAGRSVVFTGDTGPSPAVEALAKDADLMVGELVDLDLLHAEIGALTAFTPEAQSRLDAGFRRAHLTPEALAEMAARANVKALVASHLIPGVGDNGRVLTYLAAMRKSYAGPIVIARDLDRF